MVGRVAGIVGVWSCVAVLAGCSGDARPTDSPPPTVGPMFSAGSRLKPLVWQLEGINVVETWYDTELGFACLFVQMEDGVERCLPDKRADVFFTDTACTQPALGWSQACEPPSYVTGQVLQADGNCYREVSYRKLGELGPPEEQRIATIDGCVALEGGYSGTTWHALERMPPSAFVGVQEVRERRAPGLDAIVRQGEDGSSQIIGFYDTTLDFHCYAPGPDEEPRDRCRPEFYATSLFFADGSCQQPAAEVPLCWAQPEVFAQITTGPDWCTADRSQYWQVERIVDTLRYEFNPESGTCLAWRPEDGPVRAMIRGAPIPPEQMKPVETQVLGTGRVRAPFSAASGIPYEWRWLNGPFVDTATEEPCQASRFPDGVVRCVHESTRLVDDRGILYVSPDCTGERFARYASTCDAPPRTIAVYHVDSCSGSAWGASAFASYNTVTEVVAAGVERALSEAYSLVDGSCVKETFDPPLPTIGLGSSPLDPATLFPELHLVQAP